MYQDMAIDIKEEFPLASLTTMRVGGSAHFFCKVDDVSELTEAIIFSRKKGIPFFMLGGGSNTLVSASGFSGLVIKNEIKGIEHTEAGDETMVKVGAGVVWDEFVSSVVSLGLWGIENLSLIPGSVGGAVVQNAGAYGVEARETIVSVEAFDTETLQVETFLNNQCEFGYRESVFKKKKNLIVVSAIFKLTRNSTPRLAYEDVKKYFIERDNNMPTLAEVREAIIAIRTAKLPRLDLGTAGSFFKNPIVTQKQYTDIKKDYPEIKAYILGDNRVKLSAAWLIDHAGGFRGVRRGDAGTHEKQALILINYGSATADEIISLAEEIKKDIYKKTNVYLEEEVVRV